MNITQYLKDLIEEFLDTYNHNYNIKIGFDKTIIDFKNLNNFPLIVAEDINLTLDPNYLGKLIGTLNFSIMFFVYNSSENGYSEIEEKFIVDFNSFLLTKSDIVINDLTFDTDNDNVYLVNYSLSNHNFELN